MTTRLTCHGGTPVRWTEGPPTDRDRALCRLEDTAYAYRVSEEIRSTRRSWVEGAPSLTDDQHEHRTRELRERKRFAGALDGVLTFMADGDPPPVDAMGQAGTTSLREFQPLLKDATELLGLAPHKAQGLIERVPHFPAPDETGRERFGGRRREPALARGPRRGHRRPLRALHHPPGTEASSRTPGGFWDTFCGT